MSEFLAATRADIALRLNEISPMVLEHAKLTSALKALGPTQPSGREVLQRRSATDDQDAAAVLYLIRAHPGLRTDQLSERTGNDATEHLTTLKRAGRIEQLSNGWYSTRSTRTSA